MTVGAGAEIGLFSRPEPVKELAKPRNKATRCFKMSKGVALSSQQPAVGTGWLNPLLKADG
jgi:hypothetical protein